MYYLYFCLFVFLTVSIFGIDKDTKVVGVGPFFCVINEHLFALFVYVIVHYGEAEIGSDGNTQDSPYKVKVITIRSTSYTFWS